LANTLLTIGAITRETLMILENSLTFTRQVNRQFQKEFGIDGAKIGNVLNIRKPVRAVNASGQGIVLQDLTETTVPLTLTTQYQRAFVVTSQDLALNIDDFSKRFVRPHMASLANQIDQDGLLQYQNVYNEVGVPGTTPNALLTYLQAMGRLDDEACPQEDRSVVLSPTMSLTIVNALTNIFNPSAAISSQYRKGRMGTDVIGADWYKDQNVATLVIGLQGGTPTVNGGGQTGSSILTQAWSNSITGLLKKGDIVTFAGVYAVNPQSHASTGVLRQFVMTADVNSNGSGAATLPIYPPIITSGAFQTVTASPATSAAVTVQGASAVSSPKGLAFHEDAFTFACAELPLPDGVDMKERLDAPQLKMSVRLIRDYDINMDRFPLRIDLLGGWATIYPELAVRIAS
jgi:hypothetical protein